MTPTLALFSDVGGGEIIVIGVIALLLFGKNLPSVSRSVGKALAQFKKGLSDATSEIRTEMDAAASEVEAAKKDATSGVNLDLNLNLDLKDKPAVSATRTNGHKPPSSAPPIAALPEVSSIPKADVRGLDSSTAFSEPVRPPLVVRPATGTVASRAPGVSPATVDINVPAPSKIPPPV